MKQLRLPRVAIAGLFMIAVHGIALAHSTSVLEKITLSKRHHTTRIRFWFSRPPRFHDFALGSPPRAVLDMHATRDRRATGDLAGGAVRDIRLARHRHGMLRAVLDLRRGAHLAGVSQHKNTLVLRITDETSSTQPARSDTRRPVSAHNATHTPAHRAGYQVAPAKRPVVVVIDPGHGGKDPGTSGPHGLDEKTITLAIGKMVYRKLADTRGIHPVLTRASDRYVSLPGRVAIAQKHHADVFVSIHANAAPHHPNVDGGTCYELSEHGASNAEAAQVAHFENSRDREVAGVHFSAHDQTLNTILTQLFQNESIDAAHQLANSIIGQFARVEPIYYRQPQRANFAVLRDPMVASVLCETAFLSNPTQARELHHHAFRARLANAIYRGIVHYLHNNPPMHARPGRHHVYIVKQGDTLSGIAAAQHISIKRLAAINDLRSNAIKPGQHLIVPRPNAPHAPRQTRPTAARYVVQSGDTLSAIALAHHMSVAHLMKQNDLHNTRLRVGQTLKLAAAAATHGGASTTAMHTTRLTHYTVKQGDTVSQIAAAYHATTQQVKRLNNLQGTNIQPGQVLRLPAKHNSRS